MSVAMILLDWTRMGKTYCLAGVIVQNNEYRVVRPLPPAARTSPVRNVGWSPFLMDGRYRRWDVVELIHPEPAPAEPPHLEDIFVREMRSRGFSASRAERRAILSATVTPAGQPLFGAPLHTTRTAAHLPGGSGIRSLASAVVSAHSVSFTVAEREGTGEIDYRVGLDLPGLKERVLPLKDHFLVEKAELGGPSLTGRTQALKEALAAMGEQLVVRLGLSRVFRPDEDADGVCWLMVDGFFSLKDPQP